MARRGRPPHPDILTPREWEVLALLREGLSNPEIADRLGISRDGVKFHVSEILTKLGVASREEAASWAVAERRPWWVAALSPFALLWRKVGWAIGGALLAAAIAGLGLLAVLLLRSGGVTHKQGTPIRVWASSLADPNHAWLGGYDCALATPPQLRPRSCEGFIFATTDGGQTWQQQYQGDVIPTQVQFADRQFGLVLGYASVDLDSGNCGSSCPGSPTHVLVTNDGGQHWNQTYSGDLGQTHLALAEGDAWILSLTCGSQQKPMGCFSRLLRSSDGGLTWKESQLPILGYGISRPTANDAWISVNGPKPQVFATHDGGTTWKSLPSPAQQGAGIVFFRNRLEGWALLGEGAGAGSQPKEIFGTRDGGLSWTHLAGSIVPPVGTPTSGQLPISGYVGPVVFTTASDGWIGSGRLGLLHSTDGGVNWALAYPQRDTGFNDVHFTDAQHGWANNEYLIIATDDGGSSWHLVPVPTVAGP